MTLEEGYEYLVEGKWMPYKALTILEQHGIKESEESFIKKLEKINPEKAKEVVKAWEDAIKFVEEMEKEIK